MAIDCDFRVLCRQFLATVVGGLQAEITGIGGGQMAGIRGEQMAGIRGEQMAGIRGSLPERENFV